jgi:50S ribosomal protein L16 3-hydroxylase
MLAEWVAPLTVTEFQRSHLHQSAWAQPHSAERTVSVLDWDTLGEVLAAEPSPDVIVCARGERLPYPAPRELIELRAYLRMGIGLALRHTQRCHPRLAAIATDLSSHLDRPAQVQIFVTPGGTHGFGWHYDIEDVFIVQTAGVKDYYFRANTVEPDAPFPPPSFAGFGRETSPIHTATLCPGDFLYIPGRWWHMAICRETSLSISVGVMP